MESDVDMHSLLFPEVAAASGTGGNVTASMADVAANVGMTVGLAGLSSIAGGFHNAVMDTAAQSNPGMNEELNSIPLTYICLQFTSSIIGTVHQRCLKDFRHPACL